MNERILELWAQADKLAKDAMDEVPRRSYNDVLMEKFAELIVQDCLAIVKLTYGEGNGDDYSYDDALDHVEYNMKEHFKKDATGNFCSIDPK